MSYETDRFFVRYAGLLELTQDLCFWKFLFLGRLHVFPHWRISVRIWCDERRIEVLNILMRSFPCPIWDVNSSLPSWSARFFDSYISTDVLWKTSISALMSVTNFNGQFSTKNRRKRGVPRRAMNGIKMFCWKAVGGKVDLRSSVRVQVHKVNKCTNVNFLAANA